MLLRQRPRTFGPRCGHFTRVSSTRFRARSLASSAAAQPLAKSALIVSKADGVASVSLNHRPVNALTQGVCEELRQCLGELEADPQVRGLLLGSALPGLFSAGLDLHAFHKPDPDALADYWTAVQELWLALWTSDLATVAAISGHCPAGGCMVALACDARVMVEGSYGIGLNEARRRRPPLAEAPHRAPAPPAPQAQLGIAPPPWLSSMLLGRVGASRAERLLVLGELLRPAEAAELGLVDEVRASAASSLRRGRETHPGRRPTRLVPPLCRWLPSPASPTRRHASWQSCSPSQRAGDAPRRAAAPSHRPHSRTPRRTPHPAQARRAQAAAAHARRHRAPRGAVGGPRRVHPQRQPAGHAGGARGVPRVAPRRQGAS